MPPNLQERALQYHQDSDCFGEHSDGVVLCEDGTVAISNGAGNDYTWIMGKSVFSGQDHAIYHLRALYIKYLMYIGVIDTTSQPGSRPTDTSIYCSAGAEVTVCLDCARGEVTFRNVGKGCAYVRSLPQGRQYRLVVYMMAGCEVKSTRLTRIHSRSSRN